MKHGTLTGYTHHGCRCEPCRAARRAYSQRWYARNRENWLAKCQEYRENNRESRRAYSREYMRNKDRTVLRDYQRLHRATNKDYYRDKDARRRALKRELTVVPFTLDQLRARWDYYGSKCWMCGGPATETDHVKPLARGGAHMLCNLRPACLPCNHSKSDKWPLTCGNTRNIH